MLSARAYSFRQKSRLAISLSWIGGYTNVVAFLVCGAVASHVTGNVTHLGRFLVDGDHAQMGFMFFMWGTFFSGAMTSAILTESARRRGAASKYIIPIGLEAVLLTVLAIGICRHTGDDAQMLFYQYPLGGIAAFAMGLQNATITKISGAVVRTTHLTGVTTDLGIESVQYLFWCADLIRGRRWSRAGRVLRISNRHPSFQRVLLLASIIGSFLFGAIVGTAMFYRAGGLSLAAPVVFLVAILVMDWFKPISDVKELDLMADAELRVLGLVKALLPPDLGIWRVSPRKEGRWHRAPDFLQWAEKIPARWRVIVLAISPLTRFDRNAILDLQSAVKVLDDQHRKLVLSGITPVQYRRLSQLGIDRWMNPQNLCPDLEFAIARGIDLMQELHPKERLLDDAPSPTHQPASASAATGSIPLSLAPTDVLPDHGVFRN